MGGGDSTGLRLELQALCNPVRSLLCMLVRPGRANLYTEHGQCTVIEKKKLWRDGRTNEEINNTTLSRAASHCFWAFECRPPWNTFDIDSSTPIRCDTPDDQLAHTRNFLHKDACVLLREPSQFIRPFFFVFWSAIAVKQQ